MSERHIKKLAEWLSLESHTPGYLPAVERKNLSDASELLLAMHEFYREVMEQGWWVCGVDPGCNQVDGTHGTDCPVARYEELTT